MTSTATGRDLKDIRRNLHQNNLSRRQGLEADALALYSNKPDFVGKYEPIAPLNPLKGYSDSDNSKIEILVAGTNTEESMSWSDAKQVIVYEKISWWAHYASMLIHRGQVTHGWNFHDFCEVAAGGATNSCGAALIYSVSSLDEFDSLYSLDPVCRKGRFWSIVLQPIARQELLDKRRLRDAQFRLKERTSSIGTRPPDRGHHLRTKRIIQKQDSIVVWNCELSGIGMADRDVIDLDDLYVPTRGLDETLRELYTDNAFEPHHTGHD
jgi:hypothetical protein